MKIFVKTLDGRTVTVEVLETNTMEGVKTIVRDNFNIQPEHQIITISQNQFNPSNNPKNLLQEYCVKLGLASPVYITEKVMKKDSPHQWQSRIGLIFNGKTYDISSNIYTKKKEAECNVASKVLEFHKIQDSARNDDNEYKNYLFELVKWCQENKLSNCFIEFELGSNCNK